jgi:hypothetical protein
MIDPKKPFYADVPEPLASEAVNQLSFNSPSEPVYYADAAYDGHRVYIRTQALPPFAQDLFVAKSGTQWNVRKPNSSHSPLLSEPATLTQLVQNIGLREISSARLGLGA